MDELKRFGVIGRGKQEAFFNVDFKQHLFKVLNEASTFIASNTDKPATIKNRINEIVTAFDSVPIWGLFFQILTLQGLCCWLECVNINEGDNGYNEVVSLYEWLADILADKEFLFAHTPYGDKDKERLKPLCDYLYSTELGKMVQQAIFGEPRTTDKGSVEAFKLPTELDTAEARKVFQKAIEAGLMSETASGYKWQKSNVLLAFMCGVLYCGDTVVSSSLYRDVKKDTVKLNKQNDFPETKLFEVFGVKNLGQSRLQKDGQNPPKGYKKILELIEEVRAAE